MCPAVGAGKIRVGPSGKSAKRCQWQRKRAGFEEVLRLADTTVTGNRLARRWATAGPYERVARGAMGGRPQGSPLRRITRGCGTAGRCRHRPLRMTRKFLQGRAGGQGRPPLRKRYKGCNGRATARVAPTEGYKKCLHAGGQRRPPLRKRYRGCNGRATARVAPTEGCEECVGWVSAPTEVF